MKTALIVTLGMLVDTDSARAITKFQQAANEANLRNDSAEPLEVRTLLPKLMPVFKSYNLGQMSEADFIAKIREHLPLSPEIILEAWNSVCALNDENRAVIRAIIYLQKGYTEETGGTRVFIYSDTNVSNFSHIKALLAKEGLELDGIMTTFAKNKTKEALFEELLRVCDASDLIHSTAIFLGNPECCPLEFQRDEIENNKMMRKLAKSLGVLDDQIFTVEARVNVENKRALDKPKLMKGFLTVNQLNRDLKSLSEKRQVTLQSFQALKEPLGDHRSFKFFDLIVKNEMATLQKLLLPFNKSERAQIAIQLRDGNHGTAIHCAAEAANCDMLNVLLSPLSPAEQLQAIIGMVDKRDFNALHVAVMRGNPGLAQNNTIKLLLKTLTPLERIRAICDPLREKTLFDYAQIRGLDTVINILLEQLLEAVAALKLRASQYPAALPLMESLDRQLAPLLSKFSKKFGASTGFEPLGSVKPGLLDDEKDRKDNAEAAHTEAVRTKEQCLADPNIRKKLELAMLKHIKTQFEMGNMGLEEARAVEVATRLYIADPLAYPVDENDPVNVIVRSIAEEELEGIMDEMAFQEDDDEEPAVVNSGKQAARC